MQCKLGRGSLDLWLHRRDCPPQKPKDAPWKQSFVGTTPAEIRTGVEFKVAFMVGRKLGKCNDVQTV